MRGVLNSPILLVGEAPGDTEDAIGEPFLGPSGTLLNDMLVKAGYKEEDYLITNAILCTPFEDSTKTRIRAPENNELKNCSKRLAEFIDIISPRKIVAVGKKAEMALKLLKLEHTPIVHPAFILRKGSVGVVAMKRSILTLKRVLND
jgi:DNA polymerase